MLAISKCITSLIKQEEDIPHRPLPVPGKVTEQLLDLAKYMQKGARLSEQVYQMLGGASWHTGTASERGRGKWGDADL